MPGVVGCDMHRENTKAISSCKPLLGMENLFQEFPSRVLLGYPCLESSPLLTV